MDGTSPADGFILQLSQELIAFTVQDTGQHATPQKEGNHAPTMRTGPDVLIRTMQDATFKDFQPCTPKQVHISNTRSHCAKLYFYTIIKSLYGTHLLHHETKWKARQLT